jgi:hypothetical protein
VLRGVGAAAGTAAVPTVFPLLFPTITSPTGLAGTGTKEEGYFE